MSFRVTEYPNFSWSFSRDELFQECKRKYYFQYYGSHNGWFQNAPELSRKAYRLKHLTNLHLLFGTAVHAAAQKCVMSKVSTNRTMLNEDLVQIVRDHMNFVVWESKHPENWQKSPSKSSMLAEYYYGKGLSIELINKIKQDTPIVISNFLSSQTFHDVSYSLNKLYEVDEALNTISLNGAAVYVRLDLLYLTDDCFHISDWKTGKKSIKENKQLPLYALYCRERYQIPMNNIILRLEYLVDGTCQEFMISDEEVESLTDYIDCSIKSMKTYLECPKDNIPKPLDSFPQTQNRNSCLNCNYRELCNI